MQKGSYGLEVWKMNTQSAKAKGRRLQQWVRDKLISQRGIKEDDVQSRSMGAGGEDIMLSSDARHYFPYSIECKNQEKVSIWKAYEQAESNSGKYEALLIIKKNGKEPLAIVSAEHFIKTNTYIRL
jgi:hypothetical protein